MLYYIILFYFYFIIIIFYLSLLRSDLFVALEVSRPFPGQLRPLYPLPALFDPSKHCWLIIFIIVQILLITNFFKHNLNAIFKHDQ